ncbi:geranylgeranyl diphosphate synthase, type II [Nannocystis exedens]|uniref:Geranylgeranyl diphosphate synthase, type II n=1 Tax=Nannocystis exedens TaxID=54 RepID=A0A1I2EYR7_9BACT|nr:polyprenyl synthetase family protein [Nannocystis exedens]PCC69499.1 geranylgeranyl pyrophosphate synthase [Nannocystis exedens]SFE97431.1 geranylgeranyl diphosphate synthase, type II [Nannocystis exedens]
MESRRRIDRALKSCLDQATAAPCPPRLGDAMRHAVFPGGARFRPEFCLAVAEACGGAHPALADAAAAAIELLHCASLVYDDLPCFDDAAVRRGHPTVHAAFGEELAILAGNALIVLAFDALARAGGPHPHLLPGLLRVVARGVGGPSGIVAGQGWESEAGLDDLGRYHRAKTGALFEAAVIAGAMTGGGDPLQWTGLGYRLGEAYQIADDIRDAYGRPELLGKPVGQDRAHHRPSAVRELGLDGATGHLNELVDQAAGRIPACAGRNDLLAHLRRWSEQLLAAPPPLAASLHS